MTYAQINGADIYYEERGKGDETILFSHGLLWSSQMFRHQIDSLSKKYRVIAYDHRGQGKTEVTSSGYDMDTLTQDALQLLDHIGIEKVHFVGLSMGGFVGMRLAARYPDRITSLTLIETSAEPEPEENIPKYKMLGWVARLLSIRLVAGRVMTIMFGDTFLNDPDRADDRQYWKKQLLQNDRVGIHRALGGVVSREGVVGLLAKISCPTLIMVGDEDKATVPAKAEKMHQHIAGSKLVTIPKAGHTSSVEQPEFVTSQLTEFLANHG